MTDAELERWYEEQLVKYARPIATVPKKAAPHRLNSTTPSTRPKIKLGLTGENLAAQRQKSEDRRLQADIKKAQKRADKTAYRKARKEKRDEIKLQACEAKATARAFKKAERSAAGAREIKGAIDPQEVDRIRQAREVKHAEQKAKRRADQEAGRQARELAVARRKFDAAAAREERKSIAEIAEKARNSSGRL